MKITAIRVYPVWVGIRNQLLVKVETDEGVYGWGESGMSGREKAVAGAVEHYREFLIGRDPIPDRAAVAGDVPQPVLRGRPRVPGGDFGDRHRPPRHQGQGARRAGLRAARRQAAGPDSDLRDDASRGQWPGGGRAGQGTRHPGLEGDPPDPRRAEQQRHLRAAREHRRDG